MATTARSSVPLLEVVDLQVHYGHAHVLQGISLRLDAGVLGVIGRNGMGKTTLCQAILGLKPATSGSIRFLGRELIGLPSNQIAELGIGYVPQGRRTWPTLTVDEHLRLVAQTRPPKGGWTIQRVYETFPRLAERRKNGGTQLSGGEQQMLAIGRALMTNPELLILDEATEGLSPLIRQEIWNALATVRAEGMSILVIDKNLRPLLELCDRHLILEKGRVVWSGSSADLRADHEAQRKYLSA